VDIEALAGGVTNIGIRNASTTVNTPPTQNITAVGNTIGIESTYKHLNPNAAYVLTSTPTVATATAVVGQEITLGNFGGFNLTLQDDRILANTKLYLPLVAGAPANMVLNPADFVTLVWSGAFWVCKCRSDNA
jgi:hypothetical protein